MRPGSASLRGFAPTRTRPARGLGGLTMPRDWRLTPEETDGDLTATDFAGSPLRVAKSRLFTMTEAEVMADETLGAYFLTAWRQRRSALLSRGDPAWMSQPSIRPDDPGNLDFAGTTHKKGFVFGKCPTVDAMGWDFIPNGAQHAVCVVTHVAIGVLAFVGVLAAVWTLDTAGRLAGD